MVPADGPAEPTPAPMNQGMIQTEGLSVLKRTESPDCEQEPFQEVISRGQRWWTVDPSIPSTAQQQSFWTFWIEAKTGDHTAFVVMPLILQSNYHKQILVASLASAWLGSDEMKAA